MFCMQPLQLDIKVLTSLHRLLLQCLPVKAFVADVAVVCRSSEPCIWARLRLTMCIGHAAEAVLSEVRQSQGC